MWVKDPVTIYGQVIFFFASIFLLSTHAIFFIYFFLYLFISSSLSSSVFQDIFFHFSFLYFFHLTSILYFSFLKNILVFPPCFWDVLNFGMLHETKYEYPLCIMKHFHTNIEGGHFIRKKNKLKLIKYLSLL